MTTTQLLALLTDLRDLLSSQPDFCLGTGSDSSTGMTWPIRDEVIDRITKATAAQSPQDSATPVTAVRAIRLLVAAGFVTQDKANEALGIAAGFANGPLSASPQADKARGEAVASAVISEATDGWIDCVALTDAGKQLPPGEYQFYTTPQPQGDASPEAPVVCDACGDSRYTVRPSGTYSCWKCAPQVSGGCVDFDFVSCCLSDYADRLRSGEIKFGADNLDYLGVQITALSATHAQARPDGGEAAAWMLRDRETGTVYWDAECCVFTDAASANDCANDMNENIDDAQFESFPLYTHPAPADVARLVEAAREVKSYLAFGGCSGAKQIELAEALAPFTTDKQEVDHE